jgi:hypothetical protein
MSQELLEKYAKLNQSKGRIDILENVIGKIKSHINADKFADDNFADHNIASDFEEYMQNQTDDIEASTQVYNNAMLKREQDAKSFCFGKTNEELKAWLANQYVPYNSWKDANHDTLVELVLNVYE